MRTRARILSAVLMMLLIVPISALAVGYERYRPAGSAESQVMAQEARGAWESLKKGMFVEKYPGLLDDAASAVKDLLSQFGVLDKKAP
jgi:hypothetical protein